MAFVVWVLMDDGLRVPPFDVHPDGSGRLRSLGLDNRVWRRWLTEVCARRVAMWNVVTETEQLHPDDLEWLLTERAAVERVVAQLGALRARQGRRERDEFQAIQSLCGSAAYVVSACAGPSALREELVQSHLRFTEWRRLLPIRSPSNQPLSPAITDAKTWMLRHDMYHEFERDSQRPASLWLELVPYPAPVVDVHPPETLVMGLPPGLAMADWVDVLRGGFARLHTLNSVGEAHADD